MDERIFIWDFDGTIASTGQIYRDTRYALVKHFQTLQKKIDPDKRYISENLFLEDIFSEVGVNLEELKSIYVDIFTEYLSKGFADSYNFVSFFEKLESKGSHIIYSNAFEPLIHLILKKFEIEDSFTIIIGYTQQQSKNIYKPAVYPIFEEYIKKNSFVFGDSEDDIIFAKNIKAKNIFILQKDIQKLEREKEYIKIPKDYSLMSDKILEILN